MLAKRNAARELRPYTDNSPEARHAARLHSWVATAFGRHTQHTFWGSWGTHSHTCGLDIDLAAPHAQAADVAEQTSPWTTAGSDAMVAVGHVPAYFDEAAL